MCSGHKLYDIKRKKDLIENVSQKTRDDSNFVKFQSKIHSFIVNNNYEGLSKHLLLSPNIVLSMVGQSQDGGNKDKRQHSSDDSLTFSNGIAIGNYGKVGSDTVDTSGSRSKDLPYLYYIGQKANDDVISMKQFELYYSALKHMQLTLLGDSHKFLKTYLNYGQTLNVIHGRYFV